jgi:sugar phosphate isomerase/epimerase
MQRRQFLSAAAVGSAAAYLLPNPQHMLHGAERIERNGPPRFRIGLAAYSFREFFEFNKGKTQGPSGNGPAIDMAGFLQYCVDHEIEAAELTSYFFPPSADEAYFRDLKRKAYLKGVTISGTAIGNNFTIGKGPELEKEIKSAMEWIDRAAILGAPHIRFFAGKGIELAEDPTRLDDAADALIRCAEHAATKGIFLGVENHGGLTPDQLLTIVKRVDNPWLGINLDTGNFHTVNPYDDLVRCVDYAVNVQVKASMKTPEGKKYPADLPRIATILKNARYQGFVILEYEDERPYENVPPIMDQLRAALGV